MPRTIFVNLPVADLPKAVTLYEAIGFTPNSLFSDETAACLVWSETIQVMLLTHGKWRDFTTRPIPPTTSSEVSLALALDRREEVDAMIEAAAAHGGIADINPVQDHSFMYGRDFTDCDGHVWGPFWMDPAAMPQAS